MLMNGNDEASLRKSRQRQAVAAGNLYNYGLKLPGARIAFQAALDVGAGPYLAFEAARRHCLLELPPTNPDDYKDGRGQRRYPKYEIEAAIKARQDNIDKIKNLVNPFIEM